MPDKGIYLKLEIDDKGTPTIKSVDAAYAKAMQNMRSSTDAASRVMAGFQSKLSGLGGSLFNLRNTVIALAGGAGIGAVVKTFTDAASTTEQLKVRLKALTGSQAEGNRMFKDMADYAAKVPFTFEEVMEAATRLAGTMGGSVDEVKRWIPLVGDLAAAQGYTLNEATSGIIRMY